MKTLLAQRLPALTPAQLETLAAYYALLVEGNARMNLTKVIDPVETADKHFVDSLNALPYIPQGASCIDIGAGAGLPGIPLLIARPDISLTMLDSLRKRVTFLEETCAALGLPARCLHARAEDAGRDAAHRACYDVALARAVAPLHVLLELCIPFVRVGGVCIAYKGKAAQEEAAAARRAADLLGCSLRLQPVAAAYGERALVIATKERATGANYPRKAGIPAKKPL